MTRSKKCLFCNFWKNVKGQTKYLLEASLFMLAD